MLIFAAGLFVLVGILFLYNVGRYALMEMHPFQFFADSNTYHDMYSGFRAGPDSFIDLSYNFFGPLLILTLTGGNIYLVMILNVIIFVTCMIILSRALNLDPFKAAAIQFLSPITISSLLSVNKEILAFPVFVCLILAYQRRSLTLFAAAIFFSIMARWQLTAFCLILLGAYFARNVNRYAMLSLLTISISVSYYLAQDFLEPVLRSAEYAISIYTEGSGIFERMLELQNDGLYFLVAPFKAAHLLFSSGFRIDSFLHPIIVYSDQIIAGYCFVNLLLFSLLLATRSFGLRNDLIAISIVYLVVFALTPVFSPRYFYAVTVLWALVLAGAKGGIGPALKASS
jgi:hypothetical protein